MTFRSLLVAACAAFETDAQDAGFDKRYPAAPFQHIRPENVDILQHVLREKTTVARGHRIEGAQISNPTLCDSTVKQNAGFIDFEGHGGQKKSFFFWMFEARSDAANRPLILWLTGGPGASSAVDLLMQNGPCTPNTDGSTTPNPNSWNQVANVMYLDQPAGTGFSTGARVQDFAGVGDDVLAFMKGFYKALPQYKQNDLYIMGGQYSGHFVPASAHAIMTSNEGTTAGADDYIPLEGIAIGSGFSAPEVQFDTVADMVYNGGAAEGGTCVPKPLVDDYTYHAMQLQTAECREQTILCQEGAEDSCVHAQYACYELIAAPMTKFSVNIYDIRSKCSTFDGCYSDDVKRITDFMNLDATQKQLGVAQTWQAQSLTVAAAFGTASLSSHVQEVREVLAAKLKVLVYAGDCALVGDFLGNKRWLTTELRYMDFATAKDVVLPAENGLTAGLRRSVGDLHFVAVFAAGAQVAKSQPEVALSMVSDFFDAKNRWPSTSRKQMRRRLSSAVTTQASEPPAAVESQADILA